MNAEHAHSTPMTEAVQSQAKADEDLAWVARVQQGDIDAFKLLVQKYRARLYSVLYNMTSNREDAADLAQETFVKAFRSIGRFHSKSKFYTWLYRIGINTAVNHLKRNRFRRLFSLEPLREDVSQDEALSALADPQDPSATMAAGKELQEKLNEALQKLSNKHRTVVVLFEIEGLSHAEIAQVMGCSQGTVRSRLHYAKEQLQSYLQDYLHQ